MKKVPPKKTVVKSKKAVQVKPVQKADLSVKVYDLTGAAKKNVSLPKEIQDAKTNPKLLAQYIRVYLANQRQGNASVKTRAKVRGSTRKIYRQKGTGRARHGSRRAPIFVGGGIIFGPETKDFSLKMNKKQKRKALFTALNMKYKDENIAALVPAVLSTEPKSKIIINFLKKIQFDSKKVLFILPKIEKNNFTLASRNLSNVELIDVQSVNPYVILNNEKIFFVSDALEVFTKHFTKVHEN